MNDFVRMFIAIYLMVVPAILYLLKSSGIYELEVRIGIERAKAFREFIKWYKEKKDER